MCTHRRSDKAPKHAHMHCQKIEFERGARPGWRCPVTSKTRNRGPLGNEPARKYSEALTAEAVHVSCCWRECVDDGYAPSLCLTLWMRDVVAGNHCASTESTERGVFKYYLNIIKIYNIIIVWPTIKQPNSCPSFVNDHFLWNISPQRCAIIILI